MKQCRGSINVGIGQDLTVKYFAAHFYLESMVKCQNGPFYILIRNQTVDLYCIGHKYFEPLCQPRICFHPRSVSNFDPDLKIGVHSKKSFTDTFIPVHLFRLHWANATIILLNTNDHMVSTSRKSHTWEFQREPKMGCGNIIGSRVPSNGQNSQTDKDSTI